MIHGIINKKGYGKQYFMNKRKDEFDNLRYNVNETFQLLYERCKKVVKENKLLQERIDKAIEYIEKEYDENIVICDQYDMPITPQDLYDDLINILKGVNNE